MNLYCDDSFRKQYFADLRHYDSLKNIHVFSSSQESYSLQENGEKLTEILLGVHARYRAFEEQFLSNCWENGDIFSVELEQKTAIESLTNLKNQIEQDLYEILGENHGISISESIQWKGENVPISEILEGLKSMSCFYLAAGAEKLGCKLVARKVELVYHTKTGEVQKADSSHLECLTYALYRLNNEKAARNIFLKELIFQERSCSSQLETFIVKLGYRLVDNPQRGDLIVYIDQDGLMRHAGVMMDEKTVHSKWGSSDEILEHPIESVPGVYGKTYLFFRKDPSTLDQPWIFDDI